MAVTQNKLQCRRSGAPGALNLNVHFHMLFLDGVYTKNKQGKIRFQPTNAPDQEELAILVHTISHRVARFLERQGVLERDHENSYLQLEGLDEGPMQQLIGCSVSYRLKTPYNDGTTHVIFDPLDFIAKLASLVPNPKVNLTRFHGVFADTADRCVEDQQIIDKILSHLKKKDRLPSLLDALPETRTPPQTTRFHG